MDLNATLNALTVVLVAILGALERHTRKRVDQVHELANSNFSELRAQLRAMTAERDELRAAAGDDPPAALPDAPDISGRS